MGPIGNDTMLSLLMLAALALIVGAVAIWRRDGFGKQVWLMLAAAAVMLANVAIWVAPGPAVNAPAGASANR